MASNLTTIAEFTDETLAVKAKSKLDSVGIESVIIKDMVGSPQPHLELIKGLKLIVQRNLGEKAQEIISDLLREVRA
jgi:pyruvate/oxaloacetate carboxyltransferase